MGGEYGEKYTPKNSCEESGKVETPWTRKKKGRKEKGKGLNSTKPLQTGEAQSLAVSSSIPVVLCWEG